MKHSMLKCLSLVLALATIAGVFAVPAFAVVNECNHYAYEENWTYIGMKDPTCTDFGGKVYECPNCNKQFVDSRDWEDGKYHPLGHDWKKVGEQAPTLSAKGWVDYECNRCGDTKRDWVSETKCPNNTCVFEITNTATCTEAGFIVKTCKNCGWEEKTPAAAKGHTWDDGVIVKAPLCGVDENGEPYYGTVKFSCTVAGCNGTRLDEKVTPANDSHKWEWFDATPVSCGVNGNTAGYKCAYCDAKHPDEPYEVIVAPGHNLVFKNDEDHKDVALGCQDEVIWAQCSKCQMWVDTSDRKATDKGGNHYIVLYKDTVDGKDYYYRVDDKASTVVERAAATCDMPASYACTVCKQAVTAANATAKPHNFSIKQEPTCLAYGAYICADCGYTRGYKYVGADGEIIIDETLDKKNHEPVGNKTTVKPGCTQQGYDTYECKWCHNTIKDNYTDPLGHDKVWTEAQAATCTVGGHTKGWVCGRVDEHGNNICDAQSEWEPSQPTNALGHDFQLKENIPANCTYGVHSAYVCTRCGLYDPDRAVVSDDGKFDPSLHKWNPDLTLKTEPTCEKPGSVRLYCSVCYEESENEIEATGHSFIGANGLQNAIGRVPATCSKPGFDVYFCTNKNCDITADFGKDLGYKTSTHTVQKDGNPVQVIFVEAGSYALDVKQQDRFESHYASVNYVYNPFADDPEMTFNYTGIAHDSDGRQGRNEGYIMTQINGVLTGSCVQFSYHEWTCQDCGYDYNKKLEDDYGPTGGHVAGAPQRLEATCGANGQNGYDGRIFCERCEAIMDYGTTLYPAHDYDKSNIAFPYSENVAPSCLTWGWAKAGWCKKCAAYVREGEREPIGHKIGALTPAQTANCVLIGWDAHYNCANADCDYVLDNAAIAGLTGAAFDAAVALKSNWVASISTRTANGFVNGYTMALGHIMDYTGAVAYGCLVDGYEIQECGREGCDHVIIDDGYYFGYANHRYTDESLIKLNKAGDDYLECADSFLCCANIVPTVGDRMSVTFDACGDKKLVHEAGKHVNLNGAVIKGQDGCQFWLECQAAEADKATCVVNGRHTCHVCQYCDVEFTFDKIHEYLGNYSVNTHEADCQNYKHDVNTCNVCGHIWIANVDAENGYGDCRPVAVPGTKVEPTFAAPGTEDFVCSLCGREWTETTPAKKGVEFKITIANKLKGQKILDGSIIAVTIKTNAYEYGVSSLLSTLKYNADLFTYLGFEADNAFGQADSKNGVDFTKSNAVNAVNGEVIIVSSTEDAAAGGLQNAVLTGSQTYMTLYFRVKCNAFASDADQTFALTSISATKAVGKDNVDIDAAEIHNNDVVDLDGKIYQLADINKDGKIGQNDLVALRSLLLVEGYQAVVAGAGDINQDGEINVLDFALMQKYILGKLDYKALVASVV